MIAEYKYIALYNRVFRPIQCITSNNVTNESLVTETIMNILNTYNKYNGTRYTSN